MTAPHRRPLHSAARTVAGTGALLAVVLAAPTAAVAAGYAVVPAAHLTLVRQEPGIVEQPQPGATFVEPAPSVPKPTETSGIDPATGFAIHARTGFLVHPPSGYLIEPGTGHLLFADTLIYTNLRYDEETGEVVEIADEVVAPAPGAGGPSATASPSASVSASAPAPASASASASASAPASPESTGMTTPPAPSTPGTTSMAPAAVASATPAPRSSRSGTPTAISSTPAAAEERTASLTPVAWIGAGVLAAALVVVAVLAARRRGRHQS